MKRLTLALLLGLATQAAWSAGNNYADVKLVSKNATGDIGGITGRNTAIGTIIYGYFNKRVKNNKTYKNFIVMSSNKIEKKEEKENEEE